MYTEGQVKGSPSKGLTSLFAPMVGWKMMVMLMLSSDGGSFAEN